MWVGSRGVRLSLTGLFHLAWSSAGSSIALWIGFPFCGHVVFHLVGAQCGVHMMFY